MIRPSSILAVLAVLVTAAPAAAAGPKLRFAASSDRDGDGRVDAVSVRFSAKVKGKGKFSVAGMRVLSASKARGRRVRLRVGEGDSCDLGLLPRVRYRSGLRSARGRKIRRSRLNMERRDRRAPRLTCAVTADDDGDGRVDGLELIWSKRVRGGITGAFSVKGFAVRGVSSSSGRALLLRLGEHDGPDSGATPPVSYSRVKRGGVRGRGGQALPGGLTATRDGVAPVLASARTNDSDSDGLVDTIFASFSEPVRTARGGPSVEGAEVTGASATGSELTLGVAEGPLGTGARPQVSYGAGEVTDDAGNAASSVAIAADDGAGPVITAATSADRNEDGRLDTILVTFSEPVSHAADSDGSYPLDVPGYSLASVAAASGQTVEVSIQQSGDPDGGVRPNLRYVRGAGAPVVDGAGNEALSNTFGATADGAPPRLLGATTLDSDEDGSLDKVRFRFSENVIHVLGAGAFSAQGLNALAPLPADGSLVDVNIQEAPGANTGLQPLTFYVPPGPGGVSDLAGNLAPSGSVAAADGAGPVVVDGSTGDADSDSRIDRVHVTMSEPVAYPGDVVAPFAIGAADYTVESVDSAAGSSFTIRLVEPSAPDTGGAPAVSYSAGGSLVDLNGVQAVARAYPGRTRDTLAPSFVAAETADVDANGRLDHVDLRYSEDVAGDADPAPFTVTGRTVTGIEFSGPRARIAVSEAGAPDTDDQPSASYTPPVDPADRVKDVPEGAGDTAEEAPGQSLVQADDRAQPAIVDAVTGDVAGAANGKLDRVALTFSEPVVHAAESTGPFSVALSGPHLVSGVSDASGDQVMIDVTEGSQPDGGSTPTVTVSVPAQITDAASNPASGTTYSATEDGVRPVLLSARLGEVVAPGDCLPDPPQNGIVDCARVDWSEPVTHAANPSLIIGGGFTATGTTPAASDQLFTDVPLVEGGSPDRDRVGSVEYAAGAPVGVFDAVGNEAISTALPVLAEAACGDDLHEPNDSQAAGNPVAPASFAARLCALDEDWYRVVPEGDDSLHVMMDLAPGHSLTLEIWDAGSGTPLDGITAAGSGDPVVLNLAGLTDPTYWVRVVGGGVGDEAEYCVDTLYQVGETCLGGGGDPL